MAILPMTIGGGSMSLKDFYRDKVLNGTFDDTCTMTIYNDRLTINEGGCKVDTTEHKVYFYYDFTMLVTLTTTNTWHTLGSFSANYANYLPKYVSNNRQTMVALITDETSDKNSPFMTGYGSSSNPRTFGDTYGNVLTQGERYYVYGSWTY